MIAVRGGSGLGDALYVQAIVRRLVAEGRSIEVCCDWPQAFRPLRRRVKLSAFRRHNIHRVAHYTMRRAAKGTTQFQDCCLQAGVDPSTELRLDWEIGNRNLVDEVRARGKPVVLVQMPRPPFGRSDGYGLDLLPDWSRLQRAIDLIGPRAFKVQVGAGKPIHEFRGLDLDLTNRTTVGELLDIASIADAFLGYCSFFIPLAESFDRPGLSVWSRKGLASRDPILRHITPEKILHKAPSRAVIDDCDETELAGAVDALCDAVGCAALV